MVFGCIGRLVTAVLLLIAGAALWHFRDAWIPKVKAYFEDKATEIEVDIPPIGSALPRGVGLHWAEAV